MPGRFHTEAKEIQPMTNTPAMHPHSDAQRLMWTGMQPSRNSPSIPPLKMLLSVHQASMMLSTESMAMATHAPNSPTPTLLRRTMASSKR